MKCGKKIKIAKSLDTVREREREREHNFKELSFICDEKNVTTKCKEYLNMKINYDKDRLYSNDKLLYSLSFL